MVFGLGRDNGWFSKRAESRLVVAESEEEGCKGWKGMDWSPREKMKKKAFGKQFFINGRGGAEKE